MNYQTYIPCPQLTNFVKCYWTLEAPHTLESEKQRIVPDGCIEMIFHYGDLYKQYLNETDFIIQPKCFVFGQITAPLEIEPTGQTGIIAVRFTPDGFLPFATMPLEQMENKPVKLTKLFGNEAILLEENILTAKTAEDRIKIIEAFLILKLQSTEAADRLAKESVEILLQTSGQVSVDELSGQLLVNRRQLERKFSSAIGLSPKQLSKIIRLQATLKMMQAKQFKNLTSLAYENGYYDQAHFIKDFKEFTGFSPKEFYAGNLHMSALFIMHE